MPSRAEEVKQLSRSEMGVAPGGSIAFGQTLISSSEILDNKQMQVQQWASKMSENLVILGALTPKETYQRLEKNLHDPTSEMKPELREELNQMTPEQREDWLGGYLKKMNTMTTEQWYNFYDDLWDTQNNQMPKQRQWGLPPPYYDESGGPVQVYPAL